MGADSFETDHLEHSNHNGWSIKRRNTNLGKNSAKTLELRHHLDIPRLKCFQLIMTCHDKEWGEGRVVLLAAAVFALVGLAVSRRPWGRILSKGHYFKYQGVVKKCLPPKN